MKFKNLKKTKQRLILILAVFSLIILPVYVSANPLDPKSDNFLKTTAGKSGYDVAGVSDTTISTQVGNLIKGALSLVGTIFLALTIYAGILWMTASGNDERVGKAISIFRSAIIGLVLVVSAYSITAFFIVVVNPQPETSSDSGVRHQCGALQDMASWGGGGADGSTLDVKNDDSFAMGVAKDAGCFFVSAGWVLAAPFALLFK